MKKKIQINCSITIHFEASHLNGTNHISFISMYISLPGLTKILLKKTIKILTQKHGRFAWA